MVSPDFVAIVAALLALVLLVDVSVLWLTGRQVPELLSQLIFGIFGFYFGRAPSMGNPSTRQPQPAPAPVPVAPSAQPDARVGSEPQERH